MTTDLIPTDGALLPTVYEFDGLPPKPDLTTTATFAELYPQRFFSSTYLKELQRDMGAEHDRRWQLVLTPTGISQEAVFDPETERPAQARWELCLHFAETETLLILNKSRARLCKEITGSPFWYDWWKLGQIGLYVGELYGRLQPAFVVLEPFRANGQRAAEMDTRAVARQAVDELNRELFGD